MKKQWKWLICTLVCMSLLLVPQMNIQAQEMPVEQQEVDMESVLPETEEETMTVQQEIPIPVMESDETQEQAEVSQSDADVPMPLAAGDTYLHSMNMWTASGGHGSSNMTVWKNERTSTSAPQVIYAWLGGDSLSLFCIDYGKTMETGDSYATSDSYNNLNWEQKKAIGYVLGCAQRTQAPRNNGSFNDFGGENTFENWRLYNSTQLMIWYYINQYYTPGTNEGIGWEGVVKTCNSGWGDLGECQRIKGIVDGLFVIPSFASTDSTTSPTYKLTYNTATNQYETVLQDTVGALSGFNFSGGGLSYNRCNSDGSLNANGSYLKVSSPTTIAQGSVVSSTATKAATSGNITYVLNQTNPQDLLVCGSGSPDPVYAYMRFYTESDLQISKRDITTNQELPGATLTITSTDGRTVYDTWVSGSTPHMVHGLSSGTYVLTETIAPSGYTKAQSITFSYDATSGTTQTVVMKDSLTRVELLKTDEAGKPLAGALLEVYNAKGEKIASWTSGTEAHIITGLPVGNYILREAKTPGGYVTAKDVSFTVTDTPQTVRVVMEDKLVKARIRIMKTGDQVIAAQEYQSVYGVFKRLSFAQKPLPGVVFYIYQADGTLVGTVTTGKDGYAESEFLPWGKYYIVEKETPAGLVNTGEKLYVELTCPENFHDDIYMKEVKIENTVGDTEINVYKQGEILNIEDGTYFFGTKPLEGVIFGVYADMDILDYEGNVVIYKDECIGFIKTGADGKAALKDALVEGMYYYKEVETLEGYMLDDTKRPFTLALGNDTLNTMDVNKEKPDVNQLYKTKLRLVKSDSANGSILLSGVEFALYNEKDELMGLFVTDENGEILIDDLPYGSYYFLELKAADGYIIDTSRQNFTADSPAQMLEVTNAKTPKTGDSFKLGWAICLAGLAFLFGILLFCEAASNVKGENSDQQQKG